MTKHTIDFILDREKGRDDGKLRMRVRWGKDNRVAVNLGYRIEFSKWDAEAQRCKANTTHGRKLTHAKDINAEITRMEGIADDCFLPFLAQKREPAEDEYRKALRTALGRKGAPSRTTPLVSQVFGEYISRESVLRSWSSGTNSLAGEVRKSLVEFNPELRIDELDQPRFEEFYLWMVNDKCFANRTTRQRMMAMRSFLRWARMEGYPIGEKVEEFRPRIKIVPKTVVWLKWDELQSLYAFRDEESLAPSWKKVLDCFLLSCFTGMRISDVINLRWSDVGENHLRVVTKKTSAPLYIDLNKYSRALVEAYRGSGSEFVMPRVDNQNLNVTIKRVCRDAGINENVTIVEYEGGRRVERVSEKYKEISMHSGRRTFICNSLSLGISPTTIMKWTGHSDYESMKPYIDVCDADKAAAMSKFDK